MSLARDAQRLAKTQQRRGPLWVHDENASPPGAQPIERRFVNKQRLAKTRGEDVFRAEHGRRAAPQAQRAVVGVPGGEVENIAGFVIDWDDHRRDQPEHGADFASEIKSAGGTKKNVRELKRAEGTAAVHAGAVNAKSEKARVKRPVEDNGPATFVQHAFALAQTDPGQAGIDRLDGPFLSKF